MNFRRQCATIVVLLFLTGCAQTKYRFEYHKPITNPGADIVWPQEPDIPRYQFVGDIRGENNFKEIEGSAGIIRQGANWLGRLIFGEEAPRLLYRPQSGAIDSKNQRLYITDVGLKAVYVFDLVNGNVDVWEGISSDQHFIAPIAITLISEERLLVTDSELGLIAQFDKEGNYQKQFGDKKLIRPTGITYDAAHKRVFIADSAAHSVEVFAEEGKWLFTIGGKGEVDGKLNSPTFLTFAKNKLFVADTLNARVQSFDFDGKWLSSFGRRGMSVGDLPRPKGIAVDSEGHIYVVESYYDFLLVFNEQGQGLLPIGGTGKKPGQFYLPTGVWVDDTDKVYVADMFNSRVSVFQYLKQNSTILGGATPKASVLKSEP